MIQRMRTCEDDLRHIFLSAAGPDEDAELLRLAKPFVSISEPPAPGGDAAPGSWLTLDDIAGVRL